MLLNNIEVDVKIKCIEKDTTQTMLADGVGTSPSYVSRIVKSKEHIVNKTFIAMMEQLGYDVERTYVKRGDQ
jgi:plasmid maintenance system antidote protein VapI